MSEFYLDVAGERIRYRIKKHARARRIRITVHQDNTVIVTRPRYIPVHAVQWFVRTNSTWIYGQLGKTRADGSAFTHTFTNDAHYRTHKEAARLIVQEKVAYWNRLYGFSYRAIQVRNQRTRWGSCSSNGTLSFHYKILFLPETLQDYLVVHELCHLKQMNHSHAFWALMRTAIPDAAQRCQTLRRMEIPVGRLLDEADT